jgi:hypothetical protein
MTQTLLVLFTRDRSPGTISENTAAGLPLAFAARSDQQGRKVSLTLCGRIAPPPIGAI